MKMCSAFENVYSKWENDKSANNKGYLKVIHVHVSYINFYFSSIFLF